MLRLGERALRLTRLAGVVWAVGETVAERFDALPISPHGAGRRLLDRSFEQRQRQGGPARRVQQAWWTPAALRLHDLRTAAALQSCRHLGQRVVRGWSDDDVAELYDVLPTTLGAQLLVLAERAAKRVPDPDDPDHPAAAAFAEQLRTHGRVLVTKGDPEGECDRTTGAWHDLVSRKGHDRVLEARLAQAHRRAVDDSSQAVRASLLWVADHREDLWD